MQYAINYSSKKTSHIVFTENICLKKQNKTNKKRISDYSKIGYSFLTPPKTSIQRSEKGFFIYKNKNKVGRNYDCDISRKKKSKNGEYFFVSVHAVY